MIWMITIDPIKVQSDTESQDKTIVREKGERKWQPCATLIARER